MLRLIMKNINHTTSFVILLLTLSLAPRTNAQHAKGPLKILPQKSRYFTDGNGKAVILVGSHTWNNLMEIDRLPSHPNLTVDFTNYLSFLSEHQHNCFRLWRWENAFSTDSTGKLKYWMDPMPYARSGTKKALDGKPKFNLDKFNDAYFERLRARVKAARDQGMYVIVMLFQGFSVVGKGHEDDWKGHPYHKENNINGIDGDLNHDGKGLEVHQLGNAKISDYNERFVKKVIDVVNEFGNVLYEITNEDDGSNEDTAWQYHMINFIKAYQSSKPNQHPVGMTVQWPNGSNEVLFASPADWISPNEVGGYQTDPPIAEGSKVIINDTDHSFYFTGLKHEGPKAHQAWVWKNFMRGNHVLFMDPYLDRYPWYVIDRNHPDGNKPDEYWETLRLSMGYVRNMADRVNLAAMRPECNITSSGYCLANVNTTNAELLVYIPNGPWITVDLGKFDRSFLVEWFNPSNGEFRQGEAVSGGGRRALKAPFEGDAVLHLVLKK